MLPFLAIGAGLTVLAWLSSSEHNARKNYEISYQNLQSETKERTKTLKKINKELNKDKIYREHLVLHRASVIASKKAYKVYDEQKSLIALINKKIERFKMQIDTLKALRQNSTGKQKQAYYDDLQLVYTYLNQAKAELSRLHEQKKQMLDDLRTINAQTRDIKLYIANKCGKKGQAWIKSQQKHRFA